MKYYVIVVATIMICGVAGLSSDSGRVIAEEQLTPPGAIEKEIIPVEYIDFDPYYITAAIGKNEG